MNEDGKTCPKCAETVKAAAQICKHCGCDFASGAMPKTAGDVEKQKHKNTAIGCGVLIALAAIVGMCSLPASIPDNPSANAKDDTLALFGKVNAAAAPCDKAFAAVAESSKSGNELRAFTAIEHAASECAGVNATITALDVPASLGKEQHKTATDALGECGAGYSDKWNLAISMKKMLDGEDKPSLRAEFDRAVKAAAARGLMCAANLAKLATHFGATPAELEKAMTAAAE